MQEKKPVKVDNLKIIDHLDTYYATFDGSKIWKVESWLFKLLKMCNGEKTFNQIIQEIADISGEPVEEIRIGLKPVFRELERKGFIEML